jgi:uncharacterized hydantoinase/oxoprolinase family protein
MSVSLFYNDMSNIPENYLVYIDGEKKFGELQKNDVIYIGAYKYDSIKVYEVKLKDNKFHTSKDYFVYLSLDNKNIKKATFGPKNGNRWFGKEYGSYSTELIPESSICVTYGNLTAFGTNKDTVIEYIKKGINDSIKQINEQIISLESKISNKKKSLENIVLIK